MDKSKAITYIDLHCTEGSSDKVYHATIEAEGSGYVVNFAYGRRGSTLNTGTKTTSPVSMTAAQKIYDKLVSEKLGKGYRDVTASSGSASGTKFGGSQPAAPAKTLSGLMPQLLNPVTEDEAIRLLDDPTFALQEKIDGNNVMVAVTASGVIGSNKKGQVISLPKETADALAALNNCVLAGELVGTKYHAFDIIKADGVDISQNGFETRHDRLAQELSFADSRYIVGVETAFTAGAKAALFKRLKDEGKEGVVFKRNYSPFTPGRPASGGDQLKFKFVESASAKVVKVNDKRSVEVAVLTTSGEWRGVGNVTIPANHTIPEVGAIVEVRYLYAYPGGCLYQPVYLGERSDTDADECKESQLKYKAVA